MVPTGNALHEDVCAIDQAREGQARDPDFMLNDLFETDEFRIFCTKVFMCPRRSTHDWALCPYAHAGEKARRRDVRTHSYASEVCPSVKKGLSTCASGDACPFSHNVFEYYLHPNRYRTVMCKDGVKCKRHLCFFAHTLQELRRPAAAVSCPGAAGAAGNSSTGSGHRRQQQQEGAAGSAGGSSSAVQLMCQQLLQQQLLQQQLQCAGSACGADLTRSSSTHSGLADTSRLQAAAAAGNATGNTTGGFSQLSQVYSFGSLESENEAAASSAAAPAAQEAGSCQKDSAAAAAGADVTTAATVQANKTSIEEEVAGADAVSQLAALESAEPGDLVKLLSNLIHEVKVSKQEAAAATFKAAACMAELQAVKAEARDSTSSCRSSSSSIGAGGSNNSKHGAGSSAGLQSPSPLTNQPQSKAQKKAKQQQQQAAAMCSQDSQPALQQSSPAAAAACTERAGSQGHSLGDVGGWANGQGAPSDAASGSSSSILRQLVPMFSRVPPSLLQACSQGADTHQTVAAGSGLPSPVHWLQQKLLQKQHSTPAEVAARTAQAVALMAGAASAGAGASASRGLPRNAAAAADAVRRSNSAPMPYLLQTAIQARCRSATAAASAAAAGAGTCADSGPAFSNAACSQGFAHQPGSSMFGQLRMGAADEMDTLLLERLLGEQVLNELQAEGAFDPTLLPAERGDGCFEAAAAAFSQRLCNNPQQQYGLMMDYGSGSALASPDDQAAARTHVFSSSSCALSTGDLGLGPDSQAAAEFLSGSVPSFLRTSLNPILSNTPNLVPPRGYSGGLPHPGFSNAYGLCSASASTASNSSSLLCSPDVTGSSASTPVLCSQSPSCCSTGSGMTLQSPGAAEFGLLQQQQQQYSAAMPCFQQQQQQLPLWMQQQQWGPF